MVVEPEVFALVFAVAELSPEVVVLAVEPEVVSVAEFWVAEPEAVVSAEPEVVSVAAELSPEVVSVAAELSLEVVVLVSEPGVVFVAVVFVGVAELQASVDIVVVFVVLVPVSVVVVEACSSGHPKFFAFPNICSFPNCSSSVEVVG